MSSARKEKEDMTKKKDRRVEMSVEGLKDDFAWHLRYSLAKGDSRATPHDQYTAFAASISSMMVRSYAVAIVKPAEGKTDEVKAALEAYVASEQQSMEHYLEDQYLVAKAATVTVAPTGEVVLVCAEDHDTILANIEKALAA